MHKRIENQWKEASEDAMLNPPPEIWDRIEAQLDKDKKKAIVWWKNPLLMSGIAASIVLVLGFIFLNQKSAQLLQKDLAHTNVKKQEAQSKELSSGTAEKLYISSSTGTLEESVANSPIIEKQKTAVHVNNRLLSGNTNNIVDRILETTSYAKLDQTQIQIKQSPDNDNFVETATKTLEKLFLDVKSLPSITWQEGNKLAFNDRLDFDRPEASKGKRKRNWHVGLLTANAPFNANFNTPTFQSQALGAAKNSDAAFISYLSLSNGEPGPAQYSNSIRSDARNEFKTGSSMSFGVSFGVDITRKLSVESGLRITNASVTNISNVYAVNQNTGASEDFSTANYIRTEQDKPDVIISVNNSNRHTYRFISVPLLLNYTLVELGKFNLSAVAGVSGDIMLSSSVENSKNVVTEFQPKNSNYNALNVSGVGGLRINYDLTNHLGINLGTTYQKFLNSGISSSDNASFKPSMFGVNLGIVLKK